MSIELQGYPNLSKLFEKYNKAVNSNSKDIRISTIELSLVLQEITHIAVTSQKLNNGSIELKKSVDMLVEIIKTNLVDDSSDTW